MLIKLYILHHISLLNLLGWHWFTKPSRFQVYNSTKCHLHTATCAHRPKQSLFPAPLPSHLPTSTYTPTPFPTGYLCDICIYIYFLLPSLSFTQPPPSLLWQLSIRSMYLYLYFYFVCSIDSTYKWEHMVFVLLLAL